MLLFFIPDPQPSCPEGMFTCNNKVCAERNRVCDFTDDCGDESDEADCGELCVCMRVFVCVNVFILIL